MLAALPTAQLGAAALPARRPDRKPEVREIAAAAGLPVASRPESQDLCFLAGVGKRGFLAAPRRPRPSARGEIVDSGRPPAGRARRPPQLHGRPAPRDRHRRARAALRARHRRRRQHGSRSARPSELERARRGRSAAATLHRPAARVDAVKLRYRAAAAALLGSRDRAGGELARRARARDHAGPAPGPDGGASSPAISSSATARSPEHRSAVRGAAVRSPRLAFTAVNSDEIRETYLSFFEERGHLRRPSASLVPAPSDTSTLLTVAGMQPFKPYFLGRETPPGPRLTTSQRCFRTPDIEEVGSTKRHLTYFEMLGNFSFGDYFKARGDRLRLGAVDGPDGFGFDPGADLDHRLRRRRGARPRPRQEAIELWQAKGVPEERIVRLPRSENFWQAGPTGPCGPCSELYLDRGPEFGGPERPPRRRLRSLPRVLEPRLHGATSCTRTAALTELPAQEHRHRPRASSGWP